MTFVKVMGGLRSCDAVVPADCCSVDLLAKRVLNFREPVWLVPVSKVDEGAPDRSSKEEDCWLREPLVVLVHEFWYCSGIEGSLDPNLALGVAIVFCVVESAPSDHHCRLSTLFRRNLRLLAARERGVFRWSDLLRLWYSWFSVGMQAHASPMATSAVLVNIVSTCSRDG